MANQHTPMENRVNGGRCSVEDCERPHKCKGFCKPHYQKFWAESQPPRDLRSKARKFRLGYIGWSVERWATFNYAQGGLCYLCGETNFSRGLNRELAADHDHATGNARALLCNDCNRKLEFMEDEQMWKAVGRYLQFK